jgi:hypothetical protein
MVIRFPTQEALPECAHLMPTVPYAVRDADLAQATLMDELLATTCEADAELIRREADRIAMSFFALASSALQRQEYLQKLKDERRHLGEPARRPPGRLLAPRLARGDDGICKDLERLKPPDVPAKLPLWKRLTKRGIAKRRAENLKRAGFAL